MLLGQGVGFQWGVFTYQLEVGHSPVFPSRVVFWFLPETLLGAGPGRENFLLTLAVGPEGDIHGGDGVHR